MLKGDGDSRRKRSLKVKAMVMTFSVFFLLGIWPGPGQCSEPEKAKENVRRSLKTEMKVQEDVDRWSQEKQNLVNELLDLQTRLEWTSYQNQKYLSYIQQEKETIDDLRRKKRELKSLRMKLEPFLSQVVHHLGQMIKADLPFLPEERQNRLSFLENTLTEKDIDLHERLRRIFEALQVEAGYGNTIEVNEQRLELQGDLRQAQVLRLGRLALYYRTLDGQEVGHWDINKGQWEPLPTKFNQSIKQTIEIAQQKRAAELVDLPIGQVKERKKGERLEQ
jgi:hypothetical protein